MYLQILHFLNYIIIFIFLYNRMMPVIFYIYYKHSYLLLLNANSSIEK